jgi:hypothetical protein
LNAFKGIDSFKSFNSLEILKSICRAIHYQCQHLVETHNHLHWIQLC